LQRQGQPQAIDVNDLLVDALLYSEHIRALREQPLIRETAILEAESEFDPKSFMESKFVRTSEPVGDQLTSAWGISITIRCSCCPRSRVTRG
jgi:hypothetical protein